MARKRNVRPRKDLKTPATPKPSRQQRYRAKQRSSWLSFLGKLLLFFIPAGLATWWLVVTILGLGEELDILVLDLRKAHAEVPSELKRAKVWEAKPYGSAAFGGGVQLSGGIQLPDGIRYGGPKRNALVIFNDLLGSARKTAAGSLEPQFFVPANAEEHQTHALFGIPDAETEQHLQQWQTVDDYVFEMLTQLANQDSGKDSKAKKVLLVFDVDHPDLAGRLPPQANPFMELVVKRWNDLSQRLTDAFPAFDVCIWFSHASGQKSYLDSNPNFIESFFKHRFERGIAGDVFLEIPRQDRGRDISYADLKTYLRRRVSRDAATHNLIQTPVFLEPRNHADFELLRFRTSKQVGVTQLGFIFGYESRQRNVSLDALWEKFENVKREYDWDIENPLSVQQTSTILLQLERLWYEGKSESELFANLERKVTQLLETHNTIKPVEHSLQDAVAQAAREGKSIRLPDLPIEWLEAPVELDSVPEDQRKAVSNEIDEQSRTIEKWKFNNTDWPAALSVWNRVLAGSVDGTLDNAMLARGLELLPDSSTIANRGEASSRNIEFNEIAFLRRVHAELVWPDKIKNRSEHVEFQRLVRLVLRTREKSNRFAAELTPILVRQFRETFQDLENQRRYLEDRLFAHDGLFARSSENLAQRFTGLMEQYDQLLNEKNAFADRFKAAQSALINGTHDFRYRIESLAASGSVVDRGGWMNGYWEQFSRLGDQKMSAFSQEGKFSLAGVAFESFANIEDGHATTPAADADRFRANLDLGVADGNLLGRRLLFWPELKLEKRKQLHEQLSQEFVTLVESEIEGSEAADDSKKIGSLDDRVLEQIRLTTQMRAVESQPESPNDQEEGLLRMASISNRLNSLGEFQQGRQLSSFINRLHAQKSDLVFDRVAQDLWGTVGQATGSAFVNDALASHDGITSDRLQALCDRKATSELQKLRREVAAIWRQEFEQKWPDRIAEIASFCDGFVWSWNRNSQTSVSRRLLGPFKSETDLENKMLFSVQGSKLEFGKVGKSQPVIDQDETGKEFVRLATPEVTKVGEKLAIYLRGHRYELPTQIRQRRETKTATVSLANSSIKGTRLRIERATADPIIGEVCILIDCSKSMSGRMKKARDYVIQFLKAAADRADIEVSLYAVGAAVWHNNDGQRQTRDASQLSSWSRVNKTDDVWRYSNNGKRIDNTTLQGFSAAVEQLKHFGETPILAGIDLALDDNNGTGQPKLLVLMTDGFEFSKELGNLSANQFDETRYGQVKRRLSQSKANLVVFNMLPVDVDPDKSLSSAETQVLRRQFSRTTNDSFTLDEVVRRIKKINALADYRDTGDGARLSRLEQFLAGVLPQPFVDRAPPFPNDLRPNESSSQLLRDIQLGPEDRPQDWHLGLKFQTSSPIDIFNKENVKWTTDRRSYGNEFLQFEYNPVRGTFDLETQWKETPDQQFLEVDGQQLRVDPNLIGGDTPSFLIGSKDDKRLTPAPVLSWLELIDTGGASLLVQDFAVKPQGQSNVHPVEFPELEPLLSDDDLVTRGESLDVNFVWMNSFPTDLWAKIDVGGIDRSSVVTNVNGLSEKIAPERFVSVKDLLSADRKPFRDFDFSIYYENLATDQFVIKVRIERPADSKEPSGKSLDRWLVQLLSADGTELHRHCRLSSKRNYVLADDGDGIKQLVEVIHEFTIARDKFADHGAWIGLANLDDMEIKYKGFPKIVLPKHLKANR